eukprot:TRINITY_DN925_c0_g1_i4.p1 TRINITY_DN925_c0_g1~~TRINITY_DN925_c0_g1_i4.p1  ORF type:complete len:498 (-),score=105.84 TRINITY_DN925_c0_g1_i4:76-1569(-)
MSTAGAPEAAPAPSASSTDGSCAGGVVQQVDTNVEVELEEVKRELQNTRKESAAVKATLMGERPEYLGMTSKEMLQAYLNRLADQETLSLKKQTLLLERRNMLFTAKATKDTAPPPAPEAGNRKRRSSQGSEDGRKTFNISKASYPKAVCAGERLAWTFDAPEAFMGATSTRRVDDFVWTQDEDHKDSIAAVLRELREQLDLPDTLALIDVTTLIAYDVDAVVGDKRTRIVGKTDYFIVLKDAAAHVKRSPSQFKPYVVLIVETKTAKALADEYSKSLGSAALQCVAANFELQQQGIQRPPDGLPVLLTDMNSFFMFVCDGDRSVVRQICYPNKAVAYDQIAIKARELGAFVLERQTRATAAAGARSSRPFGGASGGGGSGQSGSAGGSAPPPPPSSDAKGGGASTGTDLESAEPPFFFNDTATTEIYTSPELAEADMAFAIHNVRAAFCPGSQECGDVLIETFDSALGRSLQQRHNLPMSKPVFRAAPRALVPGLR